MGSSRLVHWIDPRGVKVLLMIINARSSIILGQNDSDVKLCNCGHAVICSVCAYIAMHISTSDNSTTEVDVGLYTVMFAYTVYTSTTSVVTNT